MTLKKKLPQRFMITDADQMNILAAAEKLPKNSGIILRDYNMQADEKIKLALALKKICKDKKIPLLIANDTKLALKIKADGIHLPEYAASKIRFWRMKKKYWLIISAAHSYKAVKNAVDNGVDAVLISPIFKTSSHPEKKPLGILRAQKFINIYGKKLLCVYALGGVKTKHGKALKMAGFKGFAAISAFKN